MRVNREQLKAVIKECLVELLSEGLGGSPVRMQPQPRQPTFNGIAEHRPQRQQRPHRPAFDPRLDTPTRTNAPTRRESALDEAVRRESGGNPVMESILADTARTTLPSMLSHGDTASHSITQQEQFNGTPEEVFGEDNTSRWADLAFMDASAKKTA